MYGTHLRSNPLQHHVLLRHDAFVEQIPLAVVGTPMRMDTVL
jgi:hypothetical protein